MALVDLVAMMLHHCEQLVAVWKAGARSHSKVRSEIELLRELDKSGDLVGATAVLRVLETLGRRK